MVKKQKDYFNEEKFRVMLQQYQSTTKCCEGIVVERDKVLEESLVKEIEKIVVAIIIIYRYYIFEDYEDLKQHALNACYTNFMKFTPEKGTAFNYFSIISKISLLNYTDRKKKHRNHQNIDECLELEHREEPNYDLMLENLEYSLFGIIDENYIGKKREEYTKIASIIIDYLKKTKKFISKSDLYAWGRSLGVKNNAIRSFVKEMDNYREEINVGVI